MADNSTVASALANIRQKSKLMKENLQDGHLLQAFKHCSDFLNELRTSALSPKQYYELYMAVYDQLDILSEFLLESNRSKQAKSADTPFLTDLYELVQYSGNIIPRLYMMIVIGTAHMATNSSSTKDIMKDMIEMCRGVQHPIRGLFLRHHLSQRLKDLYPMATIDDFNDTVDFLITNFIEMNKLWVRLQHQGHSSERELRYQERKELKILVGSNLVRLSQVVDDFSAEGYSPQEFYVTRIFPAITEQIIQCRDHLAQSYLIDVLVQIFPDNFHFATLDKLLNNVFLELHPMLSKAELVATLVDRFVLDHKYEEDLATGAAKLSLEDAPSSSVNIFDSFMAFYTHLLEKDSELAPEVYISILRSLIKLSLTYEPTNYENLNRIYEFAAAVLHDDNTVQTIADTEALWLELLRAPVAHFPSIKDLLKLPFYHALYTKIKDPRLLRTLGLEIAEKLLLSSPREEMSTTEDIDDVFKYLSVLIIESEPHLSTSKDLGVTKAIAVGENRKVSEDFLGIQETICKVFHLIACKDKFQNLSLLFYVRKKYLNKSPENIVYTYPTLITCLTNLIRHAGYSAARRKKVDASDQNDLMITSNFKNTSVVLDELYKYHSEYDAELVFKLYLNLAAVADQLKQETIAYELYNQCFIIYEESLLVNRTQSNLVNPHESMGGSLSYQAVLMLANRLQQLRYFTSENYENLITKLTLYGSKLLKKQDQCRSVYYCAHLWWWVDPLIDEPSPTVATEKADLKLEDGQSKEEENSKPLNGDKNAEKHEPNVEEEVLYKDPKRVLECLQKSLRIADLCMDPKLLLKLFVDILNRCLIFNDYGNSAVDYRYINGLIELIRSNLSNFEDDLLNHDDEAKLIRQISDYFDRTLTYVKNRQEYEGALVGIVV